FGRDDQPLRARDHLELLEERGGELAVAVTGKPDVAHVHARRTQAVVAGGTADAQMMLEHGQRRAWLGWVHVRGFTRSFCRTLILSDVRLFHARSSSTVVPYCCAMLARASPRCTVCHRGWRAASIAA